MSSRPAVGVAANLATALFALTAVLQLFLAMGLLPVSAAWGGRQDELTLGLRAASLAAIVVLASFAWIMRRRAGLVGDAPPSRWVGIAAWVISGFLVLNTLGNLTSLSSVERLLFTPISLVLAASCVFVALSSAPIETG
jgi:hypothetical protein